MKKLKVVVLDMQPITPAVGGGRQRLLGLYHDLGPDIETVYVGSYDWPGEKFRDHLLTDTLREICVPLSDAHYRAAQETEQLMAGRGMIDIEFPRQVALSPDYLNAARKQIQDADVIVFSHPWCYPPFAADLRGEHLVVYDAHNVESVLRVSLHDDLPQAAQLLELVVNTEASLLARCDLVYCCSSEEVELFSKIFEVPRRKLRVAPNGTFTKYTQYDLIHARERARRDISGQNEVARRVVFMGSKYGPNAEAGRFIVEELAPKTPEATFVLIGGVGECLESKFLPSNVICAGIVNDDEKWKLLLSADFAINPMFSGAGTNIKMFDFLAAGLPVLTTAVGARGIADQSTNNREIVIEAKETFATTLKQLVCENIGDERRIAGLTLVERRFSWRVISRLLGAEFRLHSADIGKAKTPVLMFSTWGTACGIAEHTRYLAEALKDSRADVVMFGNLFSGHEPTGVASDLCFPAIRGWHWDNKSWRESWLDLQAFKSALDEIRPTVVILEHHTGFLGIGEYAQMAAATKARGIPTIVECHDASHLEAGQIALLIEQDATILVHSYREAERLGLTEAVVQPLPVRMLKTDHSRGNTPRIANSPIVGGFGFFREYKGIDIALESIKLLREEFPNIQYRGWHAIYPGEEQSAFVRKCFSLIEQEGLEDAVVIDTSFADIEEIIAGLAQCDLVVLPYADSNEGASAAANIALAAGVPLIISESNIFSMLQSVAEVVRVRNGRSFAAAIAGILRDKGKRMNMAQQAKCWTESNSYLSMARRILELGRRSMPDGFSKDSKQPARSPNTCGHLSYK